MTEASSTQIEWRRSATGDYEAEIDGNRWRIVQAGSKRWEIFRNGSEVDPFAYSLRDAKLYVASDVRKERKAMRVVSIMAAVPYDDRPEWDVSVQDPADPDFEIDGGRHSDLAEARRIADDLALEHDARVVDETL